MTIAQHIAHAREVLDALASRGDVSPAVRVCLRTAARLASMYLDCAESLIRRTG